MRASISTLDQAAFDVCVIGAGANGTSAAQHLAAAGYNVLLVERRDYGSGSSSRSSRLLHCGLRYLAPGTSMVEFVRHPSRLKIAWRMARLSMQARREMVRSTPQRVREMDFHFPIWKESTYRPWQVRLGLAVLSSMVPRDVPLKQRMFTPEKASRIPLVNGLRDWDRLEGVAAFAEYQLDWGERLCVDAALDAERLGATVRNYTEASRLTRRGDGWDIELTDVPTGTTATVRARLLLNMAGIWIDKVNANSGAPRPRKVFGTKGCHIVVQMPPECAGIGIVTYNSHNEPFYCIPWRGLHYFGPTETEYHGDLDSIRVEDTEIDFLLYEANHLLPGLGLARKDIVSTWAGSRPLGYDPAFPLGKRSRDIHDLANSGMPGVLAMTAGPLMTYRSSGEETLEMVQRRLKPSRAPQKLAYTARTFPGDAASPPVVEDWTEARMADLPTAALDEHAINLVDVMFGRIGVGWTKTLGYEAADKVAATIAPLLGWDAPRTSQEIDDYRRYIRRIFRAS